jgi:hypothetical protein
MSSLPPSLPACLPACLYVRACVCDRAVSATRRPGGGGVMGFFSGVMTSVSEVAQVTRLRWKARQGKARRRTNKQTVRSVYGV